MRSPSSRVILPFRFPGGKYYALRQLRPFWESQEHDEYREPFLGGGAVFWAKPKATHNWLNDVDLDLVSTLEFIRDAENRRELISLFECESEATRERHELVKNMVPRNELERIYRYYYLNRTSFSGKMKNPAWGYRPVRSLPPCRWKERIIPCGEKLGDDVKLTCLDFQGVIMGPPVGKRVLMFLDPPYYHSRQEDHYRFHFTEYDHIRLCSLLKATRHRFFLTYDDCPEIRKLYDWAHIHELGVFYRIDNSRDTEDRRRIGRQLVITNYVVANREQETQLALDVLKQPLSEQGVVPVTRRSARTGPIIEGLRSPIRFPGSKYQAVKFIAPFWDCVMHDEYREPFLGGGAVFFAKPLAQMNWLNDIDEDLILTLKYMADEEKRRLLKRRVAKVEPTKELFYELRYSEPESELERVFRYFVINRTAYSGIMHNPNWGYHATKSVQPWQWPKRIEQAGQKLQHAVITRLDYKEVIAGPARGNNVFMFIDPPYLEADQKRAYRHSFTAKDHEELAQLLRGTGFRFCLTYDDCYGVRDMYSWASIHEFSWRYHTANSNTSKRKMGKELIITNY